MEKLKGLSFKTNLGELKLKEFITYGTVSAYSASSSSDLAYFQTNI